LRRRCCRKAKASIVISVIGAKIRVGVDDVDGVSPRAQKRCGDLPEENPRELSLAITVECGGGLRYLSKIVVACPSHVRTGSFLCWGVENAIDFNDIVITDQAEHDAAMIEMLAERKAVTTP
jgi:hypothetical protein